VRAQAPPPIVMSALRYTLRGLFGEQEGRRRRRLTASGSIYADDGPRGMVGDCNKVLRLLATLSFLQWLRTQIYRTATPAMATVVLGELRTESDSRHHHELTRDRRPMG